MTKKEGLLKGNYFTYCQWCKDDGGCELKHYEFAGGNNNGEVDKTPYHGHEDLTWHFMGLGRNSCNGRIHQTDSIYYPLACECGQVVSTLFSSFCAKFQPNEEGLTQRDLVRKGEQEFPRPNPNYHAAFEFFKYE